MKIVIEIPEDHARSIKKLLRLLKMPETEIGRQLGEYSDQ